MTTARNGSHDRSTTRRLRVDSLVPRTVSGPDDDSGQSGRKFVIVVVLTVLVLWGGLYAGFRGWRAGVRERSSFGARVVAPAVDPLAEVVPDGMEPAAWRQAVADTHQMLVTVTAANVLDRARMQALRDELTARVARVEAHPETARVALGALWDDMAARAGPLIVRHPRPAVLPPPSRPSR